MTSNHLGLALPFMSAAIVVGIEVWQRGLLMGLILVGSGLAMLAFIAIGYRFFASADESTGSESHPSDWSTLEKTPAGRPENRDHRVATFDATSKCVRIAETTVICFSTD